MAMVFQDPLTALDPVFTVGWQIARAAGRTGKLSAGAARAAALEALESVGFGTPGQAYAAYPHELSGGMRQLAVIAMAVASRPALLLADEPTTALDLTTQARVISELAKLRDPRCKSSYRVPDSRTTANSSRACRWGAIVSSTARSAWTALSAF